MRPSRQCGTGAGGLCRPRGPSPRTAPGSVRSLVHASSFWVTPICSHFAIFVPGNCLEGNSPESSILRAIGFLTKERRERVGWSPVQAGRMAAGPRCESGLGRPWPWPRVAEGIGGGPRCSGHGRFYGNGLPRAGGGSALKTEPRGEHEVLGLGLARPLTSLFLVSPSLK